MRYTYKSVTFPLWLDRLAALAYLQGLTKPDQDPCWHDLYLAGLTPEEAIERVHPRLIDAKNAC